uniref:Uncharacterized protein n=1 Tax=Mortimer virus TaxID=2600330 RepID=A0A5B8XDI1_9VIRU|nr:hypothetical protein 4 [Mortimer virus]
MGRIFRDIDWHGFFVKAPVEISRAITTVEASIGYEHQATVSTKVGQTVELGGEQRYNKGGGHGLLTGVEHWMPSEELVMLPEVGPLVSSHDVPVTPNYTQRGFILTKSIGGGGDTRGVATMNFNISFPAEVSQALGKDGCVVTIMVNTSQADLGAVMLTNDDNYENFYTVTIDWNSFLDYAVPIVATKLAPSATSKGLIFQAWGIVRSNIPKIQTKLSISFTWLTNQYDNRWNSFRMNNAVEWMIASGKEMLRSSPAAVDLSVYIADLD